MLNRLTAGVVGVSGTGSIVVEQLARLGVGKLVLIEPEPIEDCNLNRVINSGRDDIGCQKVDVASRSIQHMDFGTEVVSVAKNLAERDAILAMRQCDVVFGCVDSAEGRHILNQLATFYTIPYFDVGLKLRADGKGGVADVHGSVHVLHPGGSSMLSRRALDPEQIRSDALRRQNPEASEDELRDSYIKGAQVASPAVLSFNMLYSSLVVIEFLNRLHQFREHNEQCRDWICLRLSEAQVLQMPMQYVESANHSLSKHLGRGDMDPLLARSELSTKGVSSC